MTIPPPAHSDGRISLISLAPPMELELDDELTPVRPLRVSQRPLRARPRVTPFPEGFIPIYIEQPPDPRNTERPVVCDTSDFNTMTARKSRRGPVLLSAFLFVSCVVTAYALWGRSLPEPLLRAAGIELPAFLASQPATPSLPAAAAPRVEAPPVPASFDVADTDTEASLDFERAEPEATESAEPEAERATPVAEQPAAPNVQRAKDIRAKPRRKSERREQAAPSEADEPAQPATVGLRQDFVPTEP